MKQKELEIFLQKIPGFTNPIPKLEQIITPPAIASDILFIAFQFNDIKDKKILDLGCGTGIFTVGAGLLGAEKVFGVDIDYDAIKIARNFAKKHNMYIKYFIKDVEKVNINCDTTIMNPPFGAQKGNLKADRKFIEKAFECSKIIYTLHLTNTVSFIKKLIFSLGGVIDFDKFYNFPIPRYFDFHKKKIMFFNTSLLRIITKK
jgi:putative methylase